MIEIRNMPKSKENIVVEQIERWSGEYDENRMPIINQLFIDIINHGTKIDRSPVLCCSGKYEGCYFYNGVVYENWINWGYDELFRLNETNLHIRHQDLEGRVGETFGVDLMSAYTDIVRNTQPIYDIIRR